MVRKAVRRDLPQGEGPKPLVMVLYIADGGPNSAQALANLNSICKEYLNGSFELEIVDVLRLPQRALSDGIVVTPSLAKVSPAPTVRIVGNLNDRSSVLLALGIGGASP